MNSKPYIGITGPVNISEVEAICKEFTDVGCNLNTSHIPMLGFLINYRTLRVKSTKNRRYPFINCLPELLQKTDGKVLTMVHYNSRERETLSKQIAQIFDDIYENKLCRAIQLNIVWPDITQVRKVKEQFLDMQIVFQLSHNAMKDKTPKEIAKRTKKYEDSLSYALIDPSGGRGIPFNLNSSVEIYSELREKCPYLTIGFAGGFSGENVGQRLSKLIEMTNERNFCIDAEGGLRDKITNDYGDDLVNIEKVRDYLQSASKVLK